MTTLRTQRVPSRPTLQKKNNPCMLSMPMFTKREGSYGKLSSRDPLIVTDEEISFPKLSRRIYTLELMKFMFTRCTESVLMKFVVVLQFLGFICVIHPSGKLQFMKFLYHCSSGLLRVVFEMKHKCK